MFVFNFVSFLLCYNETSIFIVENVVPYIEVKALSPPGALTEH